ARTRRLKGAELVEELDARRGGRADGFHFRLPDEERRDVFAVAADAGVLGGDAHPERESARARRGIAIAGRIAVGAELAHRREAPRVDARRSQVEDGLDETVAGLLAAA